MRAAQTICHCFGYTAEEIRRDYLKNGHSKIVEEILAAKKRGGCECALKNPKGR